MNKKDTKSILNKELDLSNLSVSKVPLYALLTITAVFLAISALGTFIDPTGPNYIAYILRNNGLIYCFSYNGMDHYITLIMGFIIGFYQFIFLQNRNFARSYLVKAQKRNKLFNEKVIFPIVAITAIVLIIKAVVLYENLRFSKAIMQFALPFLANTLIVIVHGVFGFTAGAVATILSGTIPEALIGGVALITLPKAILKIIDVTASTFLHGYNSFYSTCNEIVTFIDPTRQILETTSSYDMWYSTEPPVPVNSIIHSVFWLVLSSAILFAVKRYFSKSYKYEKIGFTNANKLLTTIICFSAAILLSYYSVKITTDTISDFYEVINPFSLSAINHFDKFQTYNTSLLFVIFFIIALVLSFIIHLLVSRKIKNIKEKALSLISIAIVFSVSAIITSTGCFGYEKRLPDIDKIEKITIDAPYFIIENEESTLGIDTYGEMDLTCLDQDITLTEKADLEILQKLHLVAIENKAKETNDGLKIEYQLKDGTTIRRNYFFLSEKASEAVMSLWDTKAVKSNYKLMLLNEGDKSNPSFEKYHNNYSAFFDGISYCYLASKDGITTPIKNKMSAKEFKELRSAIYSDITSISSKQWFTPETTYGIISFTENERLLEDVTPNLIFSHGITFQVTSEMTNTVKFLKAHDLFKYLENTETNCVAYLYDVNASEYWKQQYQFFGVTKVEENELMLYRRIPFDANKPLTHSTMFSATYNSYENIPITDYLDEIESAGYAIKLSDSTYKEYLEKSHIKYYSGVGGNLLLVYYPERNTSQTFFLP